MLTSKIINKEVLDKNANKIGIVVDINFNNLSWTIDYVVVKMNVFKKINVGVEKIDKVGDKVILKVTRDELVKTVV
jgi:sporulation protein YlmC with PRC-barrel domain